MNLLLFSTEDLLAPGRLAISDRRLQHLRQVHRAAVGDTVRVGQIEGQLGEGTLVELSPQRAVIDFELNQDPPAKLPLVLLVALPRPKMLRRIVRSAAEFGVAELYLINSYRVEKSYWQTPVLTPATLREYLLLGLEQSRDTILPRVHLEKRFKPFVEDCLPGLLNNRQGILAHPGPGSTLLAAGAGAEQVIAIGPEGGFIPYEVEKFVAAGFETVSLGPRILRVENAMTAILGRLLAQA